MFPISQWKRHGRIGRAGATANGMIYKNQENPLRRRCPLLWPLMLKAYDPAEMQASHQPHNHSSSFSLRTDLLRKAINQNKHALEFYCVCENG